MQRLATLWLGFSWVVSSLLAQTTPKPTTAAHPCDALAGPTENVCRAGYDAISLMTPIGALAVSRGNPSIGSASGGKKSGELAITLRTNYLTAVVPATAYTGVSDTVPATRRLSLPIPSLDFRMTLLTKALPVGTASVDLLASVTGIPKEAIDYLRFGSEVRSIGGVALGIGYGLRLGIAPKGPLPAVSLNIGRSDLPRFTVGNTGSGSNFSYTLGVSAINVRLMAGRRQGHVELTAGGGVDLISGDYSLVYVDQATKTPSVRADSTISTMRMMTLVNLAFHLGGIARLSFEGGFQIGKDNKLPTVFAATNTKSGRFFGGVGLGFKL